MSRSRRKIPIMGHTTCPSESSDKKIWHQRWRAREKAMLNSSSVEGLEMHLTLLEKQVSNTWSMGKDGRSYWPAAQQVKTAERVSSRQGRNAQERSVLKMRLLHKWMAK